MASGDSAYPPAPVKAAPAPAPAPPVGRQPAAASVVPALAGRTIQVVTDMSLQEQLYLYERARRLKTRRNKSGGGTAAHTSEGKTPPPLCEVEDGDVSEQVDRPDSTVYLLFMEGSTRTRESLRNAAVFHGVKVNEFQAESSSFQKNETITDAMKMLSVYSTERSVFVIRSPLEGVCSWLSTALPTHAQRFGIPKPAFINAGDGRYSHPLGEFVDIFSLLERLHWHRSAIHIALIGDLAHGRTAHSKVDGLKVFHKVRVDLVAPSAFEYPVEYRHRMRSNGFEVREFKSVEEYLSGAPDSLATIWYFYQPQFKRCGELTQDTVHELRSKVTFKAEWQSRLPPDASFFQTLPRDKEHPLIPLALDVSELNCWDRVANNAYFLHVVLLAMLFGKIGAGLPTPTADTTGDAAEAEELLGIPQCPFATESRGSPLPGFIEAVDLSTKAHVRQPERARSGGAVPLADGLVIDHIGLSEDTTSCWKRLRMVRSILQWSRYIGSEGVYDSTSSRDTKMMKGIMSLPCFDFEKITVPQMKALASIAPGCTINAIKASAVVLKHRLQVPHRIFNLPNIRCKNGLCISNPQNKQRDVVAFFERVPFYETSALPNCKAAEYLFVCKYCQWPHQYEDIWVDSAAR